MKHLFYLLIGLIFISCDKAETIKFAVCTDVHQDLIHDASDRLSDFAQSAIQYNADYVIQLGDFCMPEKENESFMDLWNTIEVPKYHVLGNHDMDISDKATIQKFWGMKKPYYSFDKGAYHFIVLDANFYKDGDQYVSYSKGNYYSHPKERCYVSAEQLTWLKSDLANTDKLTVVFSHQSLEHDKGIKNKEEVWGIFAEANKKSKKVIACFCGHDHTDTHKEIEGIHYVGLNSTSYAWVGSKMEYSGRFTEEIEKSHPNLKYTLPYEKSIFALIEINSKGTIKIQGIEGGFVKPGPEELGAENHDYSATISNRILKF